MDADDLLVELVDKEETAPDKRGDEQHERAGGIVENPVHAREHRGHEGHDPDHDQRDQLLLGTMELLEFGGFVGGHLAVVRVARERLYAATRRTISQA